jgi:hypothetical protein
MKSKKATELPVAVKSKLQIRPYHMSEPLSSLKSEIVIILLCLQFPVGHELSQIGWMLFERLLRRYVDLRISQSARQSVGTASGSTNAR